MKNYLLKAYREMYSLTFEDMGKVINLTANGYKNKEYGSRSFSQKEMIQITDFLKKYNEGLTMDKIFYTNLIQNESKVKETETETA